MSQKFRRLIAKTRILYSKKGIKGLFGAANNKVNAAILPIFYKNPFFRRIYYPKLKIAYLELTNKCNLKCKMCHYQDMQEETGYMSKTFFENCVNQLSEIGLDTLSLHFGGESLVHPKFKDFLKYAIHKRDQGKINKIGWTDNGMLFNQSIADLVIRLRVDSINFSLDGIGQVNDNIRLGSKYSIIEKNIKYLLEKRENSKKPKVSLNITGYGKTEEQKMEFYSEWIPFVDEITLIPSILPNNTWENKNVNSENLKIAPPPSFCNFPLDTIAISWNGKVTGCCLDYAFKMILGDANKESIQRIWTGSKFQAMRQAVLTNKFPAGSSCQGCEFWQVNFEPREELILDGKAKIEYRYIYRKIRKVSKA